MSRLRQSSLPWLREQLSGEGLRAFLIRGFLGSGTLKIGSAAMGLGIAILLARVLGPEGYGVYAFAFSLVSLLAIPAQMGLPTLLVREISRYQLNEEWRLLNGLLRRANQAVLALSGILLVGGGALALMLADDPLELDTLAWALLLIPLVALGNLRGAALRGLRRVVQGQLPEMTLRPALLLLFAGAVVLFGRLTPPIAMAMHALAAALAFAVGVMLLFQALPQPVRTAQPAYDTQAWLSSIVPLSFIAGMHIINHQTDIVVLGLLRTSEDVGLYRVAVQGATLVGFTLSAVNIVIAPQISRLYSAGDIARLQRVVTASTRVIFGTAVPAAALLIIFGTQILGLVFGDEYTGGHPALIVLSLGQLVNASVGSVGYLLNMTGHERETAGGMMIAASTNVILNLALIPPFGTVGAAAATAISLALWNILLYLKARQKIGIDTLAFRGWR